MITVLEESLPRAVVDVRVFAAPLWMWIALLLLIVCSWAASWALAVGIARLFGAVARRSRRSLDDRIVVAMISPLRLGIAVILVSVGALGLGLPLTAQAALAGAARAVTIVAVTWLLVRVVDLVAQTTSARFADDGRATAASLVPLGGKAAKVTLLVLAGIATLQNVGINVTGLLAGLGIGGLAVALAAQRTVENLFGGVTLILDQPVRVGDFCRFGDRVGTIEEIGLRSTRVRTLDRTVVSVPNAEFARLNLENFARRDRIWLSLTVGLRYETTPDQLRWVLVEIRKLLYSHPKVDPDPARVRFVGFGAYSLDCEVFAYVTTSDYGEFLAVREHVLLHIMDIMTASGTGFAFPSQTTYLGWDPELDQRKREDAEARVEAWRRTGDLCLPEFPPASIAKLRGTVRYPPDGAAVGER